MNKADLWLSNYLGSKSLWGVFWRSWLTLSLISLVLCYWLVSNINVDLYHQALTAFALSSFVSLFGAVLMTNMEYMDRQCKKFYVHLDAAKAELNDTETIEEIQAVFDKYWAELKEIRPLTEPSKYALYEFRNMGEIKAATIDKLKSK